VVEVYFRDEVLILVRSRDISRGLLGGSVLSMILEGGTYGHDQQWALDRPHLRFCGHLMPCENQRSDKLGSGIDL
jgi:hypothetical protein